MSEKYLAAYLNDHLAGAVMALELLEHLERAHAGTPLAAFVSGLREDITEDRKELEGLMGRLDVSASTMRKAAGWLAEKMTGLKMRMDDAAGGALRALEVLDTLAAGIEGKRSLWRALAAAAEGAPRLGGLDYNRLIRRAEEQRERLEPVRLEAARKALA